MSKNDLSVLYTSLAGKLVHTIRREFDAPEVVVEDACQFAWAQLARPGQAVRGDAAFAWLTRTASREAFRLIRRDAREMSLEGVLEAEGDCMLPPSSGHIEESLDVRDRLGKVRSLSLRQQRLVWLHAIGLTYAEMAAHEGCTRRTVERQLLRAKSAVREAFAE
jgi:RNA polymerase sigma factor (sigma-70 family)